MLRNFPKGFYLVYIPLTMLALITVGLLIAGVISPYYLIGSFIMWVLVCGLGIACGYHRVFSHRTHNLPTWKENIILFFAVFAGQGSSVWWVAVHRGLHHRFADQPKDIHSPVVHGIFQSYVGWFMDMTENNLKVNIKYSVDLLRKPNHMWFYKHYLKIIWGVPLVVCLFDWKLAFTCFFLVTGLGLLQDNLINVLGHVKARIGYRNFDTNDNSQNNIIMGYLTWGQGWHNNHHYAPASYDFGKSISGKWWEFDPCTIFLPFLK